MGAHLFEKVAKPRMPIDESMGPCFLGCSNRGDVLPSLTLATDVESISQSWLVLPGPFFHVLKNMGLGFQVGSESGLCR
jgi:hypothetical protein